MNTWVAPHLTGGIGNRLFELAATLGAAEKWGKPACFFLKMISKNDHSKEDSILKLFPTLPQVTECDLWDSVPEPNGACFIYCPFPDKAPGDRVVVEGYRQTPLYFPSKPILPAWELCVPLSLQESLAERYELRTLDQKSRTWCIHVRLGDYKTLPHHQIPILPYYQKCLDNVPRGRRVLLFSDEPELCKAFVEREVKLRGLTFSVCTEQNDVASLWLMSQCCGGAIVANSTFSWWGAYFARQNSPFPSVYPAYYPDIWGKGLPPAKDVVPSWGHKVKIIL